MNGRKGLNSKKGLNSRETGKNYENKAVSFLEKNAFQILERNFNCRQGEIDIIGIHENCLVFVEVKYRKDRRKGSPEEAVGSLKQQKICRVSDFYRVRHEEYFNRQIRYDVIGICGECEEEITWYQNAFPYCGRQTAW